MLTGFLLGSLTALLGTWAFLMLARRRCWIDLRVAPSPYIPRDPADHRAMNSLVDDVNDLRADLDTLTRRLDPYLERAERKKEEREAE